MKPKYKTAIADLVAPYAGAWIEIKNMVYIMEAFWRSIKVGVWLRNYVGTAVYTAPLTVCRYAKWKKKKQNGQENTCTSNNIKLW